MDALFAIPSAAHAVLEGPTAGTTHAALRVTLACVALLVLALVLLRARWRSCRDTLQALHHLHGLEPLGLGTARSAGDVERLPAPLPRSRRADETGATVS